MPKQAWGIGIALAGVLALTGLAILRPRRGVELPPPSAGKSGEPRLSDASCLADERAARGTPLPPEDKPVAAPAAPVRLRGRVLLPWPEKKKSEYAYSIYLFSAEGKIEAQSTFVNTDRFEFPSVTPGRKAVLFYPVQESMTPASQVVAVPERGDVEVALKPQLPSTLEGRVVDANGAGVGGVTVSVQEVLGLTQELYLQGKPAAAATVERTELPPAGIPDLSPIIVRIDPLAGRLTRSVTSDSRGRFTLPIASPSDPLPLTITRGKTEVLKEETVLPANGPVRIVVPNQ